MNPNFFLIQPINKSKLKMQNERLAQKNGELMDTFRMASVMGCFENLDNDAKPKLSK